MRTLILLSTALSLLGCGKFGRRDVQSGQYDTTLMPLASNRTWTYDVVPFGNFTMSCAAGRYTKTLSTGRTVDGKTAHDFTAICAPGDGDETLTITGTNLMRWYQDRWLLALPLTPTGGQVWQSGAITYTVYSTGSVTVPAGTFANCWTRVRTAAPGNYTTFCQSVGPVDIRYQDVFGNGWSAQLVSKAF